MAGIALKVVPKSSADRIAGRLGDAIKVRVTAAPEDGKTNRAVLGALAAALAVKPNQLRILKGHTQPRKVVGVDGLSQEEVGDRIRARC